MVCMSHPHLAYVFERFPSFTQTFCAREVLELERQGLRPLLFSIHNVLDEAVHHFPASLVERVHFLPSEKELVNLVQQWKDERRLPQSVILTLRHWENRPDKARVYEAAYIGLKLQEAGVRHAHTHFAGLGARTCWWLRQFFGCTYSFTGHANDLFCPPDVPLKVSRLLGDSAFCVTVSDFTAQWLRQHFPESAGKIHRVYNGLDLEPITAQTTGANKVDPPLILSVGRLIEKKGFDDLIRACSVLHHRGRPFQCAIVGEGPLEEQLRSLIESAGLPEQVRLAGPLPMEEIIRLLGSASVFALPCVTEKDGGRDNLPTVLMEAMAASLPCVSTRLAGVPEMVAEGETGFLCEERQPVAFADLLDRLLGDATLRHRQGQAGLNMARRLFAKEITAGQLLRLFAEFGDLTPDPQLCARHAALKKSFRRQRFRSWWRKLITRPAANLAILPEPDGSVTQRK